MAQTYGLMQKTYYKPDRIYLGALTRFIKFECEIRGRQDINNIWKLDQHHDNAYPEKEVPSCMIKEGPRRLNIQVAKE